jgi:hypothetical protein
MPGVTFDTVEVGLPKMAGKRPTPEQRRDIEARVLLAALKASMDRGDLAGAALAHKELSELLKRKQMVDTHDDHPQPELGHLDNGAEEPSQRYELTDEEGSPAAATQSEDNQEAVSTETAAGEISRQERSTDKESDTHALSDSDSQAPGAPEPAEQAEEPGEHSAGDVDANSKAEHAVATAPAIESEAKVEEQAGTAEPLEAEVAKTEVALPPAKVEETAIIDFYRLLQVDPMSTFEVIHVNFLRQVRKLLRDRRSNRDTSVWQFRDQLRALCIAHDVLRDPLTRTDYDFRLLGLRGENMKQSVETPDEVESAGLGNRTSLRIGELLHCSEILEQQELEIAIDMHKAMPEIPFGQFLVKQEFLTQAELDSALLGQRLIVDGKITVGQFQVAMFAVRTESIALSETIVLRGWANQEDVDARMQEDPWPAKLLLAESTMQVTEVPVQPGDADASYKAPIAASNALPSWAGQLDWGESDDTAAQLLPDDEDSTTSRDADEKSKIQNAETEATKTSPEGTDSAPPPACKILGTIIDTTDSSDDLSTLEKQSASLAPPITVELNDPSEFPDFYEPTITVDLDEFPSSMDPIRKLLQYDDESEPLAVEDTSEISEPQTAVQPESKAEPEQPVEQDPKVELAESPNSPLPNMSSTSALEQALALELHRLERESPFQVSSKSDDTPSSGEHDQKVEPSFDVGELEPPPIPAERSKPAKSKGERSKGGTKEDKSSESGRARRSRQSAEVEKRSTDLDDNV